MATPAFAQEPEVAKLEVVGRLFAAVVRGPHRAWLAAAKIKFNEKNELEIENYGIDPVRVSNVSRF